MKGRLRSFSIPTKPSSHQGSASCVEVAPFPALREEEVRCGSWGRSNSAGRVRFSRNIFHAKFCQSFSGSGLKIIVPKAASPDRRAGLVARDRRPRKKPLLQFGYVSMSTNEPYHTLASFFSPCT
jgi:hypothetical protein